MLAGQSLTAHPFGDEIDGHDSVWRVNAHPLTPASSTGRVTDFLVVTFAQRRGQGSSARMWQSSATWQSRSGEKATAVTFGSWVGNYPGWKHHCNSSLNGTWVYIPSGAKSPRGEFYFRGLCERALHLTGGLQPRCSSGMKMVQLAMQRCNMTSVYGGADGLPGVVEKSGLGSRGCDLHYHNGSRGGPDKCSVVKDHNYALEHQYYADWDRRGLMQLRGWPGSSSPRPQPSSIQLPAASRDASSIQLPAAPRDAPRSIYIDLGANWANTLRLYKVLQRAVRHQDGSGGPPSSPCAWEVIAFEASPVMHPFLDRFVTWLNGKGPQPELTLPPVGGSIQMLEYAKRFGCPHRHNHSEYMQMYGCMARLFAAPIAALRVDPALAAHSLLSARLEEAAASGCAERPKYTLVPAAVGAQTGTLQLHWPYGLLLYSPTVPIDQQERIPLPVQVPETLPVAVVDFREWLVRHFRDADTLVVKMDVEGAEHEILRAMIADGSIRLVDVLALECHQGIWKQAAAEGSKRGTSRSCSSLLKALRAANVTVIKNSDFGADPESTPQKMMPIDPRAREPTS